MRGALLLAALASCASASETSEDLTPVKAEVYLSALDALAREHPDDLIWVRSGSKIEILPYVGRSQFRVASEELYVTWLRMERERDDWQAFSAALVQWRPRVNPGDPAVEYLLSPVILSQDRQRAAVVCGFNSTYCLVLLERDGGSWATRIEFNPVIY